MLIVDLVTDRHSDGRSDCHIEQPVDEGALPLCHLVLLVVVGVHTIHPVWYDMQLLRTKNPVEIFVRGVLVQAVQAEDLRP